MQMTPQQHAELVSVLEQQNAERAEFIENWRKTAERKPIKFFIDDDVSTK